MSDWALVSGGSRGIGRAICERLGADGYRVVVNYRSREDAAAEVVAAVERAGGHAETAAFDVRDREATRAAVDGLVETHGAPWAVVSNAGIVRDGLMVWMEREDWDDVVDTNLGGFFNLVQPLLKPMLARRRGRIVTVASVAGLVGNAGQVNYSASKAGLVGATRSLAREVAKRSLTVNCVAPGFVETEMTRELPMDTLSRTIPAGRLGRAEEVAAAVGFLVSPEASYVTGQVLGVNGGIV